jgi:hypothetical protein
MQMLLGSFLSGLGVKRNNLESRGKLDSYLIWKTNIKSLSLELITLFPICQVVPDNLLVLSLLLLQYNTISEDRDQNDRENRWKAQLLNRTALGSKENLTKKRKRKKI